MTKKYDNTIKHDSETLLETNSWSSVITALRAIRNGKNAGRLDSITVHFLPDDIELYWQKTRDYTPVTSMTAKQALEDADDADEWDRENALAMAEARSGVTNWN